MRWRKAVRLFFIFLGSVLGIIVLLFVFLNLPFLDGFVTKQTNQILAGANVPIHMDAIKRIMPYSVKIQGVLITDPEGDTIIHVGELKTNCRLRALARKKVILKDLDLDQASVELLMNYDSRKLNIAETFTAGRKPRADSAEKKKAAWVISVKKGNLSSTHFRMCDSISGIHILQDVSGLKLKSFSVSLPAREIVANTLELDGVAGNIALGPGQGSANKKNKKGPPWNFGLLNLSMKEINFGYAKGSDGFTLEAILGEGTVRAHEMDIRNKHIDLRRISLSGISTNIFTSNKPHESETGNKPGSLSFPWSIYSRVIDLEDASMRLAKKKGPDADSLENSFALAGLDMKLKAFVLDKDQAGVEINKLGFSLDNGFTVKELEGELVSDPGNTRLNLALESDHSRLQLDALAREGFFEVISAPEAVKKAEISISDTELSLQDMSYFSSELKDQPTFVVLADLPFSLRGGIDIADSVYSFSDFSLTQDQNFKLSLFGSLKNPMQSSGARGKLTLSLSDIDRSWLNEILAGNGMPGGLAEYTSLEVNSTISGTFRSPEFDIELQSSLGNLDAVGSLNFDPDRFSIYSSFERIELGELLNNQDLGSFTGSAEVSGMGFSRDSLLADISLLVDTLNFNDYVYGKASIKGKLRPDEYEFDMQVDDSSLKADLAGILNTGDSIVALMASGSVSAQLNELHFYEDTLKLETTVDGHLVKRRKALETDVSLGDIALFAPHDSADINYMKVIFDSDSLGSRLNAEADFFQMDFVSARHFSELNTLGLAYRNYFAAIADQEHQNASARVQELPEINASGEISYHDALGVFIQDTGLYFTNLDFSIVNIPSDQRINYNIKGSGIEYKAVKIGNLNTIISDTAGILNVQIRADNNTYNSSPANNLSLRSSFSEGESLSEFTVLDIGNDIVYGLEIASVPDSMDMVFSIPSRELILNHIHWQMDSASLFTVNTRTKTLAPNLRMHTDSSFLHLTTEKENEDLSYKLILNNVELYSLLQEGLISGEPDGSISGSLEYNSRGGSERRINTDLDIEDPRWSGLSFDHIGVKGFFEIDTSKAYRIDMSALLDSSKVQIRGEKIYGGSGSVQSEFSSLPVRTFQPFVREYLSGMQGNLSGRINLASREDQENIQGELFISNAHVRINTLNSSYRIPEDSVIFSGKKINFDQFSILDSLDNKLLVDGFIGFGDHWAPYADMEVSSSKLQVMNRSEKENVPLYGNIFVDSRLSFSGPLINPDIKGQILLSEGTDVFYRYMEDLSISETEKILSFVSHSSTDDPELDDSFRMSGSAMNSSIETIVKIDPATIINFNLAKRIYNINVVIKGGGTLNYNMLNNNQVALAGKYEISEGTADLKLIGWPNKAFRIAEGGFIRWDGLFDNPELNFEALSKVSSSYTNPVDGAQRNVDFNVILKLTNQLSDLDVLFTINTSDQYLMSIINTLSPEEQMRQAITILLFEYVDLPGISTSSNYMSQQVSQLLASQLNELAKTTIQGVDISFGIDTYTAATETGAEETKTSLSYEVRKSFLNDRAQIEFSGRLDDLTQQQGNTDFSMNNLSFEYRLDSAASKFLKIYNEHSYEDVFTGEIVKTGLGFTYRKRYQYFKDIWRRKNKKNKQEPREK